MSRAGDILRFPYNGLAASIKKLQDRPDEVKRVIRAIVKANGFIRRNRDGAIQVLVNWTKTKPEFAEAAYDSTVNAFSQDGTIPEDGLRIVVDTFRKSLNISRQVPLSEVSDSTILIDAQRELGIKK